MNFSVNHSWFTRRRGGGIEAGQVLEHGLRHLAWLANDDEVVGDVLTDEWKRVLENYLPEPFRHLR